jgi:DNA-binding CsgD family transcriptional regulator
MTEEEAIQKLSKLSQRERQVLGLVCAGLMYKDIAQNLFISLPTVKAVMGRVYVKLGLDLLDKAERAKAIYQIYCPLSKISTQAPESMPPEMNEPVPMEIIKKVDEDELAVIPARSQEVIYIPEPKRDIPGRSETRRPRFGLLAGVLVLLCLLAGLYLFRESIFPGSVAPSIVTQIVTVTGSSSTENAVGVSPTLTQLLPTTTPVTQETTVAPTNPPQPTTPPLLPTSTLPSISLSLSDNFDNGANPAWNTLSGNWLTANGRYTISNADLKWAFSVLDDPSWTNYQVKVNVVRSHPGAFSEGEEAIIVRYLGSESKYLVFYLNTLEKAGWAFYDGNSFTYIAGYGSISVPSQYDLEIDAVGNEFTAKINGMVAQQINISGYENGGVGLGVVCASTPCSSFKNFQVSAVP